jgi:hypothetical protein
MGGIGISRIPWMTGGLKKTVIVREGFYDEILRHIADMEESLGFKKHDGEMKCWDDTGFIPSAHEKPWVAKEKYLGKVKKHNQKVMEWLEEIGKCHETPAPEPNEKLTPAKSRKIWHGMSEITIPSDIWDDEIWLEKTNELYHFLTGSEIPYGISTESPKLDGEKAFEIIWFLQEVTRIIPSRIERCDDCGDLYNSDSEGTYISEEEEAETPEDMYKHFCGDCEYHHVRYPEEE